MLDYNKNLINNAKELRKNMTPWEIKLWTCFLRSHPVRFQRQKVIGNYIVDFYCAKAHLVIELDGGGHYHDEQSHYDEQRTCELEKYNLRVIRFSNLEVHNNFYEVCSYIDRELAKSLPQSSADDSPLVRGGKG